jgi:predicted Zn-ribbon and HTH transcriptional regulator
MRIQGKKKNNQAKERFFSLAIELLADFPERIKNIFKQRFGLGGNFLPQTLEKIGEENGVTRERIRQIISDNKKQIIKKYETDEFKKEESAIIFVIENNCGIIKESDIFFRLNSKGLAKETSALKFLVSFSQEIKIVFEKGFLEKSWINSVEILNGAKKVITEAEKILREKKRTLSSDEIYHSLAIIFPDLSKKVALSYLSSSFRIKSNQFEKWGLRDWPEINPKGSREKIYLTLKETGKPLHFLRIVKLINKYKLGEKKIHPQTIHNELIKDRQFILIGRGIYALSEWGYRKGTVRDVIVDILREKGRPLSREEILRAVLSVREVKKDTIVINLKDKNFFEKDEQLFYSLKK